MSTKVKKNHVSQQSRCQKDNKTMQELKEFLKRYHTPRHNLKKLDLHQMDERSCIEQHSQLKNELASRSQTFKNGRLGQA